MPGVYGDHSTSGWNEWSVDAHFALKAVDGDAAQIDPARANTNPVLYRARIEALDRLGFLAAQELRAANVEISGFEPEEDVAA